MRSITVTSLLGGALIVVMALLAYYPALNGPFLLDDHSSVTSATISHLNYDEIKRVATGDKSGTLGRSIPALTFAANHYYGDGSTWSFKTTNLMIHLLNSLLMFTCLFLVSNKICTAKDHPVAPVGLIFFCTAIWTLHPIQVSTVMYVVQRMTMLSTMFSLLALITFLNIYREQQPLYKKGLLASFTGFFVILACLSKENGILTLFYMTLIHTLIIANSNNGILNPKKVYKWALVLLPATLLLLFIVVSNEGLMHGYEVRDYGIIERSLSQIGVLLLYLKMIVTPNIADMTLYHDGYPVSTNFTLQIFVGVTVLLSIFLTAFISIKRHRIVTFGIGIFFIAHILESSIFPLELVFEHRNYLASAGVILTVTYIVYTLLVNLNFNRVLIQTIATLVIGLLLFQSYNRSIEWSDEWILHSIAMENFPRSKRLRNKWTSLLAKQGELPAVISHLDNSIEAMPDRTHFKIQKLMFNGALEIRDRPLLDQIKLDLSRHPVTTTVVAALLELANSYQQKRFEWPDTQIINDLFEYALKNPKKRLKSSTASVLYGYYHDLLLSLNRTSEAMEAIKKSVELDPASPESILRLSRMYFNSGKSDAANKLLESIDNKKYHDRIQKLREEVLEIAAEIEWIE